MNANETRLTKREFVTQIQTREHRLRKRSFFGGLLVAFWLIAMALADYAKDHGLPYLFGGVDVREVFGWMCAFSMCGLLAALLLLGRGVVCPNCRKPLCDIPAQIAVATGNCGHCGEKVFDET
jgi:hypothetical protein